nr:omptin family outer membrane protease [candidate division Zixibacteria bacterium]
MTKTTRLIILFLLVSVSVSNAGITLKTDLGPIIKRGFGHAEYVMDAYAWSQDEQLYRVKSKLTFPLDFFMAGVEIGIVPQLKSNDKLSFSVGLYTNINNPGGLMKDYDWSAPAGYRLTMWSYTESDADQKALQLDINGRYRVFSWNKVHTYLYTGFRYQKLEQDINGYTGWQLNSDPPPDTVFFSETHYALYYRVTFTSPMIGLIYSIKFTPGTSLDLMAAYSRFYASDYDDHVLRRKVATANGWGNGIYSSILFKTGIFPGLMKVRPFLEISGDVTYLKASMPQTQEWYGDDPISDIDDTGIIIHGIPHDISSFQFWLGLKLGMEFGI